MHRETLIFHVMSSPSPSLALIGGVQCGALWMWDKRQSVLQACSSWATLTTWGILWREEGWASLSTMFASGGVCSRTSRIYMTTAPCCRWTQELDRSTFIHNKTLFLSILKNRHIKTVVELYKISPKIRSEWACQKVNWLQKLYLEPVLHHISSSYCPLCCGLWGTADQCAILHSAFFSSPQ